MIITKTLTKAESDFPNFHTLAGTHYVAKQRKARYACIEFESDDQSEYNEGSTGELITDKDYYREYNALHQLIRVRRENSSTGQILEEYWYNPNGDRIKTVRRNNRNQNTTIYTPFKEWMQIRNSTGTYDYTYIYDGNTLIARKNPDNTTWFYHDDHLDSTNLITDQNGNIVEETFYTPFGQTTSGGKREAYFLYTDQFKDTIGCYDYGARVYCPKWYHFTSSDPITANVFEPQKLNKYSYVNNNPYIFIDPTGKKIKSYGASKGYGTGSAYANSVNAAESTGSNKEGYLIQYETDDNRKRSVWMSTENYENLLENAQDYAENSIYAKFSIGRNIVEEYIVAFIEQQTYKQDYEMRGPLQIAMQNPALQTGAEITASVATSESGSWGGVATTGFFTYADLKEKQSLKQEISSIDLGFAGFDILTSVYGGKLISATGMYGADKDLTILTNLASETTSSSISWTVKAAVVNNNNQEGDENG